MDPVHDVEAVTAGLAFSIPFTRGEIQGLTTGAAIWPADAVGLPCGFDLWSLAGPGPFPIPVLMGVLHPIKVRPGIAADRKEHDRRETGRRRKNDGKDDAHRQC